MHADKVGSAAFAGAAKSNALFDYHAEVSAFYAALPEYINTVFFFEIRRHSYAFIRPLEDAQWFLNQFSQSQWLQVMLRSFELFGSAAELAFFPCDPARYVLLRDGAGMGTHRALPFSQPQAHPQHAPSAHVQADLFDHEVGHALCKGGQRPNNLSECLADAYMALRHIQRFGGKTGYLERKIPHLAALLFFDSKDKGIHFTVPVLERIVADSKTTDFSTLSIRETVALAERYANAYAAPASAITRAYQRYAKETLRDETLIKKMAQEVLTSQGLGSLELTRWGLLALKPFLDQQQRLPQQNGPIPDTSEWQELRRACDVRLRELQAAAATLSQKKASPPIQKQRP